MKTSHLIILCVFGILNSVTTSHGDETKERPSVKACKEYEEELTKRRFDDLSFLAVVEYGRTRDMRYQMGEYGYRCGGVLIAKRFVLTIGRCLSGMRFTAKAVMFGLPETADGKSSVTVPIKAKYIHPDYIEDSTYNDIAILELEYDIPLKRNIFPICLQTEKEDLPANANISGVGLEFNWGKQLVLTNSVLKGKTEIVTSAKCNETFAEGGFDWKMARGLDDTQICIENVDSTPTSCLTVGGSPLVYEIPDSTNDKTKYRLMGLKSYGGECGEKIPDLFTSIVAHLDFIENIVWPSND